MILTIKDLNLLEKYTKEENIKGIKSILKIYERKRDKENEKAKLYMRKKRKEDKNYGRKR